MSFHPHRPELHVTPEQGILSAPAGALRAGETWHMFHQYAPGLGQPPRWAHQYAEDMPFDWDVCNDVLAPEGEEIALRAGSVIGLDDGTVELFFTSKRSDSASVHVAVIKDLDATTDDISDDALELDADVERVGEVVGDRDGFYNFRSPCVVALWEGDKLSGWLMLAVSGPEDAPVMVALESPDRRNWTVRGRLTMSGTSGLEGVTRIVSPRIMRLKDEVDGIVYDILLVTLEHEGIDISGYLVGRLNGAEFEVKTPFTRFDFGHDFTRPRNTNVVIGDNTAAPTFESTTVFGLMNGIGRFDEPSEHLSLAEEGWVNCLSLPRVCTLQDGLLFQTPPNGMPLFITNSNNAALYSAIIDTSAPDALVQVELIDAKGNVAARITHMGDSIEFDRSMNPNHIGDHIAEGPLIAADTDAMTIVVDGSTVEVFADGGAMAMASRVYFPAEFEEFRVTHSASATIERQTDIFPFDYSVLQDFGEEDAPLEDELTR